jgi:hypothetical protein
MDFRIFKNAVAKQFQAMFDGAKANGVTLYRTDVPRDDLWDTYLSSFPEGTNPIFRERTANDCSACRQFIKAVGNVVALTDEGVISIWDISVDEPAYQTVANDLSELVKSYPIQNVFLHTEKIAGVDKNFEDLLSERTGKPVDVRIWEHFFVNIPDKYYVRKDGSDTIGSKLSEAKVLHDVLKRSLDEITDDAADTVLDLT